VEEKMKTSSMLTSDKSIIAIVCALAVAGPVAAEVEFNGVWIGVSAGAGFGGPAPDLMTDEGKARVAEFAATHPNLELEPGDFCVMAGMPGVMSAGAGYPIEFLYTKGRITVLSENENQVRRIYMDGRPHPDDLPPTSSGHSIGHWDGDTLVIDTTLFKGFLHWTPHSDQMHTIERIRYAKPGEVKVQIPGFAQVMDIDKDGDVLINEITLIDPVFYKEPLKITYHYQRMPTYDIIEYDCTSSLWEDYAAKHAVPAGAQ
jgi:hypothetical protein